MGSSFSINNELCSNEYITRFVGENSISSNDPFWNAFLSFTIKYPLSKQLCEWVQKDLQKIVLQLLKNNLQTCNVNSLICVFLIRAQELKTSAYCQDSLFLWQGLNALFVIRSILRHLVEVSNEEFFLSHLQSNSEEQDGALLLEQLMDSLIALLTDLTVDELTYWLHVEALGCLINILASQVFSQKPIHRSIVFRTLLCGKCSIHSCILMRVLMENYINHFQVYKEGGSIVLDLASGIWNMLRGSENESYQESVLSNHSMFLMLLLTCHNAKCQGPSNPYREALFSFTNVLESKPVTSAATFRLNYDSLYNTLCQTLHLSYVILLLYLLLQGNNFFHVFLLGKPDLKAIVLPILHVMYNISSSAPRHNYMALIVLLILTQDDSFCQYLHKTILEEVDWFQEKLSGLSIGDMVVLIILRAIRINLLQDRDIYLQTNCLATLSNMSAHFYNLHPYVCQKLISFFEIIVINSKKLSVHKGITLLRQEILRSLLQVFNSCLSHQLKDNPHLLYSLLHKADLFNEKLCNSEVNDVLVNINNVIKFFFRRISNLDIPLQQSDVMQVIEKGIKEWSPERLKGDDL